MTPKGYKSSDTQRASFNARIKPIKERIMDRIEFDTISGCWLWSGAMVNGTGYGTIGYGGRTHGAHRASYETFNGPIPAGMHVCHKCDVRACVNPSHLFVGTHKDNMADMSRKGRAARQAGSSAPGAILHERDIPIIRDCISLGNTNREIGTLFGVSPDVINAIRAGRSWKCVPVK